MLQTQSAAGWGKDRARHFNRHHNKPCLRLKLDRHVDREILAKGC